MSSEISHFNSFISQRATGIPYTTQWMVHFGIPWKLSDTLDDEDAQTWNISRGQSSIINSVGGSSNTVYGNILAQSVTIPGDKLTIARVGIDSSVRGGFMPTPILNSRGDPDDLNISFLETNYSFVDLVIRPWIVQVGHQGLVPISSDPKDSIKTTLWVMFFDRGDATSNTPPSIRKRWTYYNAVPTNCGADTVDFQKNQITTLNTTWSYSHYTVDS